MTRHRSLDERYLKQQLSLDPRAAATRIVVQRNEQLGLVPAGQPVSNALPSQSLQAAAGARSVLASIRNQFWTLPLDTLKRQLAEVDLRPYPELSIVVDQLQQAAAVRDDFPRLAKRLDDDLGLFHCVKQSVTMPPRDVAGMKESVMRALLNGENEKTYKATAKIVKDEFPQIYALQREWFEDILKAKRLGRDTQARSDSFALGAPVWVFALLFMLLLRGCVSIMR